MSHCRFGALTENYKDHFLRQINVCIGPTPRELLKFLHITDTQQSLEFDSSTDSTYQHQAVLSPELYSQLEKKICHEKLVSQTNDQFYPGQRIEFLQELEHIHNKVIFDAFNESLDQFRIYGSKGMPYPWKVNSNRLVEKKIGLDQISQILQTCSKKVLEWANSLCGIMFDKEDSPFYYNGFILDEEYVASIKEDRLARMLANEVRAPLSSAHTCSLLSSTWALRISFSELFSAARQHAVRRNLPAT